MIIHLLFAVQWKFIPSSYTNITKTRLQTTICFWLWTIIRIRHLKYGMIFWMKLEKISIKSTNNTSKLTICKSLLTYVKHVLLIVKDDVKIRTNQGNMNHLYKFVIRFTLPMHSSPCVYLYHYLSSTVCNDKKI